MPGTPRADGLMPTLPAGSVTALGVSGVMAVSPDLRSPRTGSRPRGDGRTRTLVSGALMLLTCGLASLAVSGCGVVSGWFDDDTPKPQAVPVLKVAIGQCFATPPQQSELTDLESVPC